MGGVRLGGRVASADSISFMDQADCKKKKKVGVGEQRATSGGGGRRRFFIAPLSICPALQDVKVRNYGVAEWSTIKGTPSIWLRDTVHHRGEVSRGLMVNYLASGQQRGGWRGKKKKRKQVAREHKTSQDSQYPPPRLNNSVFNSQDKTQRWLTFAKQLRWCRRTASLDFGGFHEEDDHNSLLIR